MDQSNPASLKKVQLLSICFCTLLLCLYLLAEAQAPEVFPSVALLIYGLAQLSAIAACLWNSAKTPASTRLRWQLYALAQALAFLGMLFMGWHVEDPTSFLLTDLPKVFIFSGAAMSLFAITGSFRPNELPSVKRIDLFLILLMTVLFFIFSISKINHDRSATFAISVLDIRTLFLAICSLFQLSAMVDFEERRFFYVATMHIWIGGLILTVHNHIDRYASSPIFDFGLTTPCLLLIGLALWPTPKWVRKYSPSPNVAKAAQAGGPCLMGLGLVLLGIAIYPLHIYIGICSIVCAVLAYGLRNALIQGKLLQIEEELQTAKQKLDRLVVQDALTGIANRRAFDRALNTECRAAIRTKTPISLLMIDVDHFKQLNDNYGHLAGDQCLAEVASILQRMLPRTGDVLCRYGGEEFAVILPITNQDGALAVAERLRQSVAENNLASQWNSKEHVTISIGVTTGVLTTASSSKDLLKIADEALYQAKRAGRNRVHWIAF